jgi:dTDP-glucose 4,6-dehydratase
VRGEKMMRLLVTGGAGFIGCNVIRHLIDRPELSLLVNLDCLTYAGHLANLAGIDSHPKYRFEKVDLRNLGEVRRVVRSHGITHILHLAAESHVDRSIATPADFITSNIVGTFNLLEAARENSRAIERFHHVSTDEVYGSLGPEGMFAETTPYAPNSPYSASKASSDLLVRAYRHTYGLNTVITNCSNNFGPYQHPEKLIPLVIRKLAAGQPIPVYGDGGNVRDWLFVLDHAEALWQVLLHGRPGESYNIGAGNEWPNLRLVQLICDLYDEIQSSGPRAASRSLLQFVPDRPGHDRRYAIDPSKIQRELGWRPTHPFQSSLRATIRWYLDRHDWVRAVSAT